MAAGAAPAPEKTVEAKDENNEVSQSQPQTLKQRIVHKLHEIFQGREEYLGWRQ
jgi:hypothetical protein